MDVASLHEGPSCAVVVHKKVVDSLIVGGALLVLRLPRLIWGANCVVGTLLVLSSTGYSTRVQVCSSNDRATSETPGPARSANAGRLRGGFDLVGCDTGRSRPLGGRLGLRDIRQPSRRQTDLLRAGRHTHHDVHDHDLHDHGTSEHRHALNEAAPASQSGRDHIHQPLHEHHGPQAHGHEHHGHQAYVHEHHGHEAHGHEHHGHTQHGHKHHHHHHHIDRCGNHHHHHDHERQNQLQKLFASIFRATGFLQMAEWAEENVVATAATVSLFLIALGANLLSGRHRFQWPRVCDV